MTDMFGKLILIFAISLINDFSMVVEVTASGNLRLCVIPQKFNMRRIWKVCENFTSKNTVECVFENDRLSCMRYLIDGIVDFAVFEPEDLVVFSIVNSISHILITHELKLLYNETASFDMIALSSSDIHSLSDLKGKKFCHPGIKSQSSEWTRIFANFFQTWIAPKKCEPDATLIENEFSSLAEYFHSACIAGSWVPDDNEDNILKIKYKNLHALCDKPNDRSTDDIYYGREGAIKCLIDGVGDVAWVRLTDIQQYFKTFHTNNSSYNYICPDGLARPVTDSRPCIWISKPWPVIAAHKNNAEKVLQLLRQANNKSLPWHKYLMDAMALYYTTPVALDTFMTPEDYLHQFNGFSSATMRATCRPPRNVKWCIASTIENEKCQWMRDVAIAYGIEPEISCHQFNDRDGCIEAVNNGHSELFISMPEELTVAYEKNLTSLLHVMPKNVEELNTFRVLVRDNSKLWSLEDLYGTRACFPSRRSFEWNAFVSIMRARIITKQNSMWSCFDDEVMTNFFKEIITFNNLAEDDNENGGNDPIEIIYDCLISGRGDVAFVNLHHFNQTYFYKYENKLRSICADEMESEKVVECILTWTPLATAMVHVNMTLLRRTEIQTMLSLLDESFGFKLHDTNPRPFLLYGSFNHKDNIIFPMKTHYLQPNINHEFKLPRCYFSILEQLRDSRSELLDCNAANSYATLDIVFILMSVMILLFVF